MVVKRELKQTGGLFGCLQLSPRQFNPAKRKQTIVFSFFVLQNMTSSDTLLHLHNSSYVYAICAGGTRPENMYNIIRTAGIMLRTFKYELSYICICGQHRGVVWTCGHTLLSLQQPGEIDVEDHTWYACPPVFTQRSDNSGNNRKKIH